MEGSGAMFFCFLFVDGVVWLGDGCGLQGGGQILHQLCRACGESGASDASMHPSSQHALQIECRQPAMGIPMGVPSSQRIVLLQLAHAGFLRRACLLSRFALDASVLWCMRWGSG